MTDNADDEQDNTNDLEQHGELDSDTKDAGNRGRKGYRIPKPLSYGLEPDPNTLRRLSEVYETPYLELVRSLENLGLLDTPDYMRQWRETIEKDSVVGTFTSLANELQKQAQDILFSSVTPIKEVAEHILDIQRVIPQSSFALPDAARSVLETMAFQTSISSQIADTLTQVAESHQQLLKSSLPALTASSAFSMTTELHEAVTCAIESLQAVQDISAFDQLPNIKALFDTTSFVAASLTDIEASDEIGFSETGFLEPNELTAQPIQAGIHDQQSNFASVSAEVRLWYLATILVPVVLWAVGQLFAYQRSLQNQELHEERMAIKAEQVESIEDVVQDFLIALVDQSENKNALATYVVVHEAPVRSDANGKAPQVARIYPNQQVRNIKKDGTWVYVSYQDYREGVPRTGWVNKRHLKLIRNNN